MISIQGRSSQCFIQMLHQEIVYSTPVMKPSPPTVEMRLMKPRRDGIKLKMWFEMEGLRKRLNAKACN